MKGTVFEETVHHVITFTKGTTDKWCDATMIVGIEGSCKRPKSVGGSTLIVMIVELAGTFVVLTRDGFGKAADHTSAALVMGIVGMI